MIQAATWKTIHDDAVAGWAVVGPLVYALIGVLVGAYIANRNQIKSCLLDNKRQEYRELLSTLSRTFEELSEARTAFVAHGPEEQRRYAAAEKEAITVIRDRIFIAREVETMKLEERWTLAMLKLDTERNTQHFTELYGELRAEILNAAERDLR